MKDRSTLGNIEFVAGVVFYDLISMIWFKSILFRCLPGMTYYNSKFILWGLLVCTAILSTILFRYKKTEWTKAVAVVIPYGVYTVIAYYTTVPLIVISTLVVGTLLSFIYIATNLTRKIKNKRYAKQIIKNRIYRCLCVSNCIIGTVLLIMMLSLGIRGVFGTTLQNASVKPKAYEINSSQTITENIDIIVSLKPNSWDKLDVTEKLNVMQTVANIEVSYLGIPHEINVGTANLRENTLGCYEDKTHTVYIDLDHIEKGLAQDVLDTCCHEVYHCYQHRLVDNYLKTDETSKNLLLYSKARSYMEEFNAYKNGYKDFCSYYYQECESDAREYAEKASNDYYRRIDDYLEKDSQ